MDNSRFNDLKRFLDLSHQIGQLACGLAHATLDNNHVVSKTYAEAILQMSREQENITVDLNRHTYEK